MGTNLMESREFLISHKTLQRDLRVCNYDYKNNQKIDLNYIIINLVLIYHKSMQYYKYNIICLIKTKKKYEFNN